jgi:hypothetical protein
MRVATSALLLTLLTGVQATAQDRALDTLLFARSPDRATAPSTLSARTIELYRIPFSYPLRSMDGSRWGISLTFPVSVTGARAERILAARSFVKTLGVVAIVPGIEFEIPVSDGVRLRPFAEAGVGRGTQSARTEILYGAGASARVDRSAGRVRLTFGGNAMRRKLAANGGEYDAHSTFEAGADAQIPLGFSIDRRAVRGGLYGIARAFDGLTLKRAGLDPIVLRDQFEAGISFSTAPEVHIWKITLPWVAVGYQFGPAVTGVRIYTSFPF